MHGYPDDRFLHLPELLTQLGLGGFGAVRNADGQLVEEIILRKVKDKLLRVRTKLGYSNILGRAPLRPAPLIRQPHPVLALLPLPEIIPPPVLPPLGVAPAPLIPAVRYPPPPFNLPPPAPLIPAERVRPAFADPAADPSGPACSEPYARYLARQTLKRLGEAGPSSANHAPQSRAVEDNNGDVQPEDINQEPDSDEDYHIEMQRYNR